MDILVEIFLDPDTGKQIIVWRREVLKTREYLSFWSYVGLVFDYFSSNDPIGYRHGRF